MSSLSSLPTPTECRVGLAAALTAVGEQSFFGYVNLKPEQEFAPAAGAVQQWLLAIVDFRSDEHGGRLRIALPAGLAGDLLAAFLGLPDEDTTPELTDMVGEFANMLCGYWLTEQCPEKTFALTKPIVTSESATGGLPWAAATTPLCALLNDQPVAIWLELPGESAR